MDFGLSQEVSEDLAEKSYIITNISCELQKYFKDKDYGKGISFLAIGVISINPKFDFFFKPRRKYSKSKKMLEYDVKLDYDKLTCADDAMILEMLCGQLQNSFKIISELKIPDFDKENFICDADLCFEELKAKWNKI